MTKGLFWKFPKHYFQSFRGELGELSGRSRGLVPASAARKCGCKEKQGVAWFQVRFQSLVSPFAPFNPPSPFRFLFLSLLLR